MNRKKLVKSVRAEVLHVIDKTGIDISKMSDQEPSNWIKQLVERYWE
jgi:hypothetical protein